MFPSATYVSRVGWIHLVVFGALLPALVVRNARRIADRKAPLPARMAHFQSSALTQVLFVTLSLVVALRGQRLALFPAGIPHPTRGLIAGVLAYAAAVAFMRPRWRTAVLRRARVVHLFMPENATERGWWLVVSVLAGVGEEITWRGVEAALLVPVTGSYALAAVLSALSFALAHAIQGWRSVAIILLFGLGFQAVVAASGCLYVAMAVHVAYDVTAGLTYGRLGRELGYVPDL